MKNPINILTVCAVFGAAVSVNAQYNLTVDPTQTWLGYMNVSELPANGGGYDFGSPWGTSALDAFFTGPTLTLQPNYNIDQTDPIDAYWWQAPNDGTSPGNHIMAASMYVEDNNFAGGTVNFSYDVLDNTLAAGYTSVAFIDDFTPSYSLVNTISSSDLTAGINTISLNVNPGDILQYGFVTTGPNARVADMALLGQADVTAVPEPATLALLGLGLIGGWSFRRNRAS